MEDSMDKVVALSDMLRRLKDKFEVNSHKVHLLRVAATYWDDDAKLKVTDLVYGYTYTSRAITHRMVRELVSSKLLKETPSKEDKRVKFLSPGAKFEAFAQAIGG